LFINLISLYLLLCITSLCLRQSLITFLNPWFMIWWWCYITNTTKYEPKGLKYIIRTIRVNMINSWKSWGQWNIKENINTINSWKSWRQWNVKRNINTINSWKSRGHWNIKGSINTINSWKSWGHWNIKVVYITFFFNSFYLSSLLGLYTNHKTINLEII
jgi:hypothetical protein